MIVRHWAKARYWCWPLPPDGAAIASLVWPAAGIDADIGTFLGQSVTEGARRSIRLDSDMRHTHLRD